MIGRFRAATSVPGMSFNKSTPAAGLAGAKTHNPPFQRAIRLPTFGVSFTFADGPLIGVEVGGSNVASWDFAANLHH